MTSWLAPQLRLSVFSDQQVSLSDSDWSVLTGISEAENRSTIPGGRVFFGTALGAMTIAQFQGTRADIILRSGEAGPPDIDPYLGLADALKQFVPATERWLRQLRLPIKRIAFGATLLFPVETVEAGYHELSSLLRSVKISPGMRDLLYRCNWRRTSKEFPDVELNRLTTWTILTVMGRGIQLAGGQVRVIDEGNEMQFVQLEVDHNTAVESSDAFNIERAGPIYDELVGLALENTQQGEVQ